MRVKDEKLDSREKRKKKKKKRLIIKTVILVLLLVILGAALWLVYKNMNPSSENRIPEQITGKEEEPTPSAAPDEEKEDEPSNSDTAEVMAEADLLAQQYDYDGAMAKLMEILGYENDSAVVTKIAEYQSTKDSCVPVNPETVTHIFYHSLVVDPEKAFDQSVPGWEGFCQWMTTVDEFNQITQQMYDNGYVLISLKDLATVTTDADGTVHFENSSPVMLPPGKKAFVLSLDDTCYYHSYDNHGIASRIVLGEDGKPTCEYIQDDGTVVTGDYDCVPLLDKFIEEHPDAAYKGARGTIALTGYNGILGYRTDGTYGDPNDDGEPLGYVRDKQQQEWLDKHPDFNWEKECQDAKTVADALKAEGWTFASHTWGHHKVADLSYEGLVKDTERFQKYVDPLIGGTDMIIFAHGQDLTSGGDYTADNQKFTYLKSKGYNYFCNVDSAQYFVQIRDNYVRQGRRNLDGYRLWNDVHGEVNKTSDLFDAKSVLDPKRTTVPEL